MLQVTKYVLYTILMICSTSCINDNSISQKCNKEDIISESLLTASEALDFINNNKEVIIIQVSKPVDFIKEHIPNALNIWRPDFRSGSGSEVGGLRCSKTELEILLSKLGVDTASTLLIYDNKGSVDAFRFTWILELYGYHKHKVINGGLKSWKNLGYQIDTTAMTWPQPSNYKLAEHFDSSLLAELSDVKRAISDPNTLIVDTRETYEYMGQPFLKDNKVFYHKDGAHTAGAIPTAVHLNWSQLSDLGSDHRIKCKKDLIFDLANKGITPDKDIILYCQSGSRSSHTAFVLRHLLGYPNVKNYDGSWIEWSYEFVKNKNVEIDQKTLKSKVDEIYNRLITELVI